MSTRLIKARKALLIRGATCRYCGCGEVIELTVEHLTPISRGGTVRRDNLGVSCFRCDLAKAQMTDEEFKAWIRENGLPRMKKDGWRKRTMRFVERRKQQRAAKVAP